MYEGLGAGWATSLLGKSTMNENMCEVVLTLSLLSSGFIATTLVPVPFLLDKYGERLRRSQYTASD